MSKHKKVYKVTKQLKARKVHESHQISSVLLTYGETIGIYINLPKIIKTRTGRLV